MNHRSLDDQPDGNVSMFYFHRNHHSDCNVSMFGFRNHQPDGNVSMFISGTIKRMVTYPCSVAGTIKRMVTYPCSVSGTIKRTVTYPCSVSGTINQIVKWIEKATENPGKRRFRGFTPWELTQGLEKLAVNDTNKMKVGRTGGSPAEVTIRRFSNRRNVATHQTHRIF